MDELTQQTTYPRRESKNLEFKSRVHKFDSLIKTCIAFANGVGGEIIIGVEDKTRQILGINDAVRDRMYDDFANSLYDSTSPRLIPQIYEQRIGDVAVLVIEIPPSLKKPCFLRSKGSMKGIYIRIGTSTRQANEEHIEELMRESKRLTYDEEPIHTDLSILSKPLLSEYYRTKSKEALLEDKIIVRAGVNSEIYYPTRAGVMLFAETPERFIPEATIMCTRFSGDEGRNIIQTEEIKGPISKQIDISFNLVSSWLKRSYQLIGTRMKSKTLLPEEALREALTNAVIHRKYSIHGATKVALYEHRLEIFSPGNFPGHININNLGEGITHFRNPIIGRMAHKMGLIEKLGSGIRLIFDSCRDAGIVAPEYSEDGDYVKVIFRFEPVKSETKTDEELLLDLFNMKASLSSKEMIDYLGRSKNTTFNILRQLMKDGVVKRIGKGKATRYVLV